MNSYKPGIIQSTNQEETTPLITDDETPNYGINIIYSKEFDSYNGLHYNNIDSSSTLNIKNSDPEKFKFLKFVWQFLSEKISFFIFTAEFAYVLIEFPFFASVLLIKIHPCALIYLLILIIILYAAKGMQSKLGLRIISIFLMCLTIFLQFNFIILNINVHDVLLFWKNYFALNLLFLVMLTTIKLLNVYERCFISLFLMHLFFWTYIIVLSDSFISLKYLIRLVDMIYYVVLIAPIKINADTKNERVVEYIYYVSLMICLMVMLFGLKIEFTYFLFKEDILK